MSAGANVKAVQRMLGQSAAMTLDIYADLFDDDLDAVAVALREARGCIEPCQNVGTAGSRQNETPQLPNSAGVGGFLVAVTGGI